MVSFSSLDIEFLNESAFRQLILKGIHHGIRHEAWPTNGWVGAENDHFHIVSIPTKKIMRSNLIYRSCTWNIWEKVGGSQNHGQL